MSSLSTAALREAARALEPRVRPLRAAPARPTGRYVLYWCTTALRAEENPAFERALVAAHKLAQPLVVYHGLSSRYAHANDRITGFVLEAEPALRAAFEARGARYVFALDRGERGTRWLDRVADGASVVVTDEFPAYDVRAWAQRFALRFDGPVLAVDAACVVPMQSTGRAYERAFAFRERVAPQWSALLEPVVALPDPPLFSQDEPLLSALDTVVDPTSMADLIATLPIDHTVPRSPVLRGGIDAALARWAAFSQGPGAPVLHGAERRLARWLELLASDGLVSMLDPRSARAKAPLTAAARRLLAPLEERVRREVRARSIARSSTGWTVTDADGQRYECERMVLATPAPQALELARTSIQNDPRALDDEALARLSAARYSRTLVAMALCEGEGDVGPYDRAIEGDAVLSRLIVERLDGEPSPMLAIVAHASEAFSEAHYDEGEDGPWGEALIERARALCGAGAVVARDQKRWRYSRVVSAANEKAPPFVALDARATLFAIGDGVGFSAERRDADAAWDSASALASWLLAKSADGLPP
jgi:predicted NAD/FAD-dependent oxidoreductase